jgi:capsular polysaccharide biosynthesis protein
MTTLTVDIKHGGGLWHYGHFFYDCLMPMVQYFDDNQLFGTIKTLEILQHARNDDCGTFTYILEKMLQVNVVNVYESYENAEVVQIIGYLFNPTYDSKIFVTMINLARQVFNITPSKYKVVFITRGVAKLAYNGPNGASKKGADLPYSEDIVNTLSEKYGSTFKNAILEDMTIDEQISLFMNAKLVIGQDGAGMCNIVWMTRPNATIIELKRVKENGGNGCQWFKIMAMKKGYKYIGKLDRESAGKDVLNNII